VTSTRRSLTWKIAGLARADDRSTRLEPAPGVVVTVAFVLMMFLGTLAALEVVSRFLP
jgi:hypothetical protein